MKNYHSQKVKEIVLSLETDLKNGLNSEEAKARQTKYGENQIPKPKPPSKLQIFLAQFKSPLIYFLGLAGLVTAVVGELGDSLVIFASVFINALFGYFEENKSLNILEKLEKVLRSEAVVIRDGQKHKVLSGEITVGDLIFLQAGDKVPADARLVQADNLKISEAVLTGEWLPAEKSIEPLSENTALAERDNMVYGGSLVESGEGKALVVAIGADTEFGKIATLVAEAKEEDSPLQKKLASFSKVITIVIVTGALFIFIGGLFRGGHVLELFEAAVAISVGGIPEALPVVMTIILAIGMDRLLKKKGLIRRLSSVETLGSTTVVCFDKTKTLTEGKMKVAEVVGEDSKKILEAVALTTEAFIENPSDSLENWHFQGTPTGRALLARSAQEGISKVELDKNYSEILRVPFDPKYKYMLSLREKDSQKSLYILGAPERVLAKSLNQDRKAWEEKITKLMGKGMRVVGVAVKKAQTDNLTLENIGPEIRDFTFLGLIGLEDPLREGIDKAIKTCRKAGIRPIIITGDHLLTARNIALQAGFKIKDDEAVESHILDDLQGDDFQKMIKKVQLFARAEPKHKIRIVNALQESGEVVAMVGDGVNDAPAIKKADIGIALGSGTEVATAAADLVLLNDSFEIIIQAVEQGRVILDNLKKAISYTLADSFTSIILIGFSKVAFGWPLPILPVQILWNNFVEDTLPNIAYAFEPKEEDVMERPPNPIKRPLLDQEMRVLIFWTGFISQFLILILFWYFWKIQGMDLDYVRTLVFGAISLDTAFVTYSYKSLRKNIWDIKIFSNKWLNLSSLFVFFAYSIAIYVPFFQNILHTVPLGFTDGLILIGIAISSVSLIEITKWFFISRHLTDSD